VIKCQPIKRVAVLYGGWSHETNYAAYQSVIRALQSFDIEAIPIDVRDADFISRIQSVQPNVVFPTNQGVYGEAET
jgi:D-alanine-D-alanine ligase-like ATP-grasp enzyme